LLAPAVRSRVVDCTYRSSFVSRKKLLIDEWQILAERESALDPVVGLAQRDALQ
jgi:hypothetical protein